VGECEEFVTKYCWRQQTGWAHAGHLAAGAAAPCVHVASDPEISVRGTSVDWQDGGFLSAAPTCVRAKDIA
jgi:hypothetical protein